MERVEYRQQCSSRLLHVYSYQDGPAASAKLSSMNDLWNVGSACFMADGSILRLYTPTKEFQNKTEISSS